MAISNPSKVLPFSSISNGNLQSYRTTSGKVPPELLLLDCVKPVVLLTKFIGLFPIQILKDGSVRHKWCSKAVLYSFIYMVIFFITSAIYLPFVFRVTTEMNKQQGIISFISEMIFFMGQYIASILTLLLNQWMAPRIAYAWNNIQDVTCYFGKTVKNGHKLFKTTFIMTRALFIIWIGFLIGYTIFFCLYFWKPLSIYYHKDSSPYFIFAMLGYILFCTQMSGHLIHIILAGTFLRMVEHSLTGLNKLVKIEVKDSESFIKFYNTFCYLENIASSLNTTFGPYTVIQIFVMIMSTLVNMYFTIYFQQGIHRGILMIMPPMLVVLYSLWLLRVCNVGERIQNQSNKAMKAMKALRHAAVFQLNSECNSKITGLLGRVSGPPIIITAGGFFRINRKLMTKVITTMTTYLIFLVQIKIDLLSNFNSSQPSTNLNNTVY